MTTPQLPPRPNFITDQERAGLDPNLKLAPQQKALVLAMLAKGLQEQLSRDPRIQPLAVTLDTRPTGWTLSVDIPKPGPDELTISEQGA